MDEKPRQRRFRFSVRTLFILVTIVAIWIGWSFNWIRQRREFVRPGNELGAAVSTGEVRAPGMLWIFGEQGAQVVLLFTDKESDFERARRLFPEAHVETNPVRRVERWISP
jgi:hypothetical protein